MFGQRYCTRDPCFTPGVDVDGGVFADFSPLAIHDQVGGGLGGFRGFEAFGGGVALRALGWHQASLLQRNQFGWALQLGPPRQGR